MRRKEVLNTKKNIEEVKSKIRHNLTNYSDSDLPRNRFKRQKFVFDLIFSGTKFIGSIKNNYIILSCTGIKYWPITHLELFPMATGTQIRVSYKMSNSYLAIYLFVLIMFSFIIVFNIVFGELSRLNDILVFILILCIYAFVPPIIAGFMQKNTREFLIK